MSFSEKLKQRRIRLILSKTLTFTTQQFHFVKTLKFCISTAKRVDTFLSIIKKMLNFEIHIVTSGSCKTIEIF